MLVAKIFSFPKSFCLCILSSCRNSARKTLLFFLQSSSDLRITEGTLLDVEFLEVNSIVITGNGKLVFNRGHVIVIRTLSILVNQQGHLIIGSEICRHNDTVEINLIGESGCLYDPCRRFQHLFQLHGSDNATVHVSMFFFIQFYLIFSGHSVVVNFQYVS